jgi:hypothetical protein
MPYLGSMYTNNDEGTYEMAKQLNVKDKGSAGGKGSAVYSVDEERAGSEDFILHDNGNEGVVGGIMRTTQVDVVVGDVEKKGFAL